MRAKVSLHSSVAEQLRVYSRAMQDSFYARLHQVRESPIERSQPYRQRNLSRYLLRCFRFGPDSTELAIFQWSASEQRMVVLECQSLRRK